MASGSQIKVLTVRIVSRSESCGNCPLLVLKYNQNYTWSSLNSCNARSLLNSAWLNNTPSGEKLIPWLVLEPSNLCFHSLTLSNIQREWWLVWVTPLWGGGQLCEFIRRSGVCCVKVKDLLVLMAFLQPKHNPRHFFTINSSFEMENFSHQI